MLYTKQLLAYSDKLQSMGIFKNRKFEVYQSTNPELTGKYYDPERKPASFVLVVFDYNGDTQQFYLRYPGVDFFVELKGHTGSSWGTMTECHLRNILEEEINPFIYEGILREKTVTVYKHETEAVIKFDNMAFNFLSRVDHFQPNDIFNCQYIPLPTYRTIEYGLQTKDGNYILVDYDANLFTYEGMRCFYGNIADGIKEGVISDFARYRDGGTTKFTLTIDGKEHKFFYPTRLGDNTKKPTWDDVEVTDLTEEVINMLCSNMGIKLAPKTEK